MSTLEGTNRDGPWWIDNNWKEQGATLTNGNVSLALSPLVSGLQAPPTTPARRQGALVAGGNQPTPLPLSMPAGAGVRLGKRKVGSIGVDGLAAAAAAACRQRSPLRARKLEPSLE